ncbi:hypothetical protein sr10066 [Sporisorium reilianum SRZ2]|uniref:Uncharacterized protein n=2 Tax=Sporisorium reilianum TaxID=72558 RepID=E6ZS81_SPORE|nr:hypothetical protein sr10066 [Sporisorium reilianum SRZ2]SJX65735.1 uncharacterized protein SRS1_10066 [Sporisorium reilianum f. sp. reilianum]
MAPGLRFPDPQSHIAPPTTQFPPLRFMPPTLGAIDRRVAQEMASGIVGGETTPLPWSAYNQHSLYRLSEWSQQLLRNPASTFYFHVPYEEPSIIHLATPIPSNVFQQHIFSQVKLYDQSLQPFAVFKTQLGQRNLARGVTMQIAGVELMYIAKANSVFNQRTRLQSVPLQQVFHYIEHGMQ